MNRRWGIRFALIAGLVVAAGLTVAAFQASAARNQVGPRYGSDGALELPADYRQWVFVGSSLGLSYSQGQAGMEMFHETLMEPSAYKHFVDTGTFREGTMLALILHGTGESVLPARRGKFAAAVQGVEMAVKDTSHRPEGWAYYNFGGMNGLRPTAQAMPKESCFACHVEHAERDNVFLQFYPLLAEAAHLTSENVPASTEPAPALALKGLDPVALIDGREEMGKPEIVANAGGLRYQFVSEPNRVRFTDDPAKFAIQNTDCLVVPGAPIDPSLFAVHEHRIYAFATSDCVERFKNQPTAFVSK